MRGADRPQAATSMRGAFIVRLQHPHQGDRYVGPFPDEQVARGYGRRLERSSNGTLNATVVPLAAP